MKIYVVIFFAVFCFVASDDDGRYRPDYHSNYGRYNFGGDGRYYNSFGRYNNYYRNNGRQYKPYQELLTPFTFNTESSRNNAGQIAITTSSTTSKPFTVAPVYSLVPETNVPTTIPIYQRSNIKEGQARIVSQDNDVDVNNYRFSYLTENGISAGESGVVENSENGGTKVTGFYEYIGADGLKYRVDYTADENGFHPTGAHLPKA